MEGSTSSSTDWAQSIDSGAAAAESRNGQFCGEPRMPERRVLTYLGNKEALSVFEQGRKLTGQSIQVEWRRKRSECGSWCGRGTE